MKYHTITVLNMKKENQLHNIANTQYKKFIEASSSVERTIATHVVSLTIKGWLIFASLICKYQLVMFI